jgi:hypothetical protein
MTDLLAFLIDVFVPTGITNSDGKSAHKLLGIRSNAIFELVQDVFRSNRTIAVGTLHGNSGAIFSV